MSSDHGSVLQIRQDWKSVTYHEAYLHAYDWFTPERQGLKAYFRFYNARRPHSSLDGKTPDQVYFESLPSQAVP